MLDAPIIRGLSVLRRYVIFGLRIRPLLTNLSFYQSSWVWSLSALSLFPLCLSSTLMTARCFRLITFVLLLMICFRFFLIMCMWLNDLWRVNFLLDNRRWKDCMLDPNPKKKKKKKNPIRGFEEEACIALRHCCLCCQVLHCTCKSSTQLKLRQTVLQCLL